MISISPDIIEKLPEGCHDCPFSFYDEHNGSVFYCGLSRFSVNKQRKQRIRHAGCGLIDPDYDGDETEKPKEPVQKKEETIQDRVDNIVSEAKHFANTLREDDILFAEEELTHITLDEETDGEDEGDGSEESNEEETV